MYGELRSKAGWSTLVPERGTPRTAGMPLLTCIWRSISSRLRRRASCWMSMLVAAAGATRSPLLGVRDDEGGKGEAGGERKACPSDRPVGAEGGECSLAVWAAGWPMGEAGWRVAVSATGRSTGTGCRCGLLLAGRCSCSSGMVFSTVSVTLPTCCWSC